MDPKDLYLLQDGTQAAPGDVETDKTGVLRHKNGMAVCLSEDGTPQTVGKNAETSGNVAAANAGKEAAAKQITTAVGDQPAADVKVVQPAPDTLNQNPKVD